MSRNLSAISVVRLLHEKEFFYFTSSTLADLLGCDRSQVYSLVRNLVRTGLVAEIENGKYLLLGFEPQRVLANPLFIASHLVTPGYISFWSALHYYGFTEQVPLTVFVATTKKKSPVEFAGQRFRFVTLQPHKFFGYRREQVGGLPVLIADEAKAIIDSLSQPEYAGGIAEIAKALRAAIDSIEIETLVEYTNRLGDKTLGSRLGFLLEHLGHPVAPYDVAPAPEDRNGEARLIRSTSLVKLDPSRPKQEQRNARWRIDVNPSSLKELSAEGIG